MAGANPQSISSADRPCWLSSGTCGRDRRRRRGRGAGGAAGPAERRGGGGGGGSGGLHRSGARRRARAGGLVAGRAGFRRPRARHGPRQLAVPRRQQGAHAPTEPTGVRPWPVQSSMSMCAWSMHSAGAAGEHVCTSAAGVADSRELQFNKTWCKGAVSCAPDPGWRGRPATRSAGGP